MSQSPRRSSGIGCGVMGISPSRRRSASSRAARVAAAIATLCVTGTIVGFACGSGLACGGTTGREGLPDPSPDGGQDATVALVETGGQDASLGTGAFDVTILYADVVLPDVAAPAAEAGEAGYPWPNCPPFLPIVGYGSDGAPVVLPPDAADLAIDQIPSAYDDAGQIVAAPDGSACAAYGWLGSVAIDQCTESNSSGTSFALLPPCNWCVDAGTAAAGPGIGSPRYELCIALYQCMMRTGCAARGNSYCICGTPSAESGCFVDAGGPCANEELAALEALPGSAGVETAVKNFVNDPTAMGGTCGSGLNQVVTADTFDTSCFPCGGIGTATEATPNAAAGTCPAGQSNTLKDKSGNFCCAATGNP